MECGPIDAASFRAAMEHLARLVQVEAMARLERTAFAQVAAQVEDSSGIASSEAVHVDRHEHSRRHVASRHHTKDRKTPNHDELAVVGELARLVEELLEVAQFHAQDQGEF